MTTLRLHYTDLAATLDRIERDADRFARGLATIGGWAYDPRTVALVFNRDRLAYSIDLARCESSAATLDWIAQFASKTWATSEDVGDLVRALNAVIGLQANLCGSGKDSPSKARRKIRALREQAPKPGQRHASSNRHGAASVGRFRAPLAGPGDLNR